MNESEFCGCNNVGLEHMPPPLFRLVCHCTTCQNFFGRSYNDECTFFLKDCQHLDLSNIEFRGYQKGFSPIKRGTCKSCGKVSFCKAKFGPFAEFLMVSTESLHSDGLPGPFAHLYYASRYDDIDDHVKKINGHYRSQLAIQLAVIKALAKAK